MEAGRSIYCGLVVLMMVLAGGCRAANEHASEPTGRTVVVWISIDGFRHDYADRAKTPFLHKLMREGAYSRDLVTITPSLTFPSHVSEATGVPVAEHGIPANDFYDSSVKKLLNFPAVASMLRAEPIWLTAERQHVRTLVYDWPLSQAEAGAVKCDYFLPQFDNELSDQQRLDRLLETWQRDTGDRPLQLLMGYIKETDVLGHKYGPESQQINAAVAEIDGELDRFVKKATQIFRQKMRASDKLYLVLTTDHGMAPVTTLVNIEKLFTAKPPHVVKLVTSGPLGMIYLDQLAPERAGELEQAMLRDLRRFDFLGAYARRDLPRDWHFDFPSRVGDIVVMLKPGYSFSNRLPLATFPTEKVHGPLGMHGYPPARNADMAGFCVFWRVWAAFGRKGSGEGGRASAASDRGKAAGNRAGERRERAAAEAGISS